MDYHCFLLLSTEESWFGGIGKCLPSYTTLNILIEKNTEHDYCRKKNILIFKTKAHGLLWGSGELKWNSKKNPHASCLYTKILNNIKISIDLIL